MPYGSYTREEVADIVDDEGIGYAVTSYMDEKGIEPKDTELRAAWVAARQALAHLEKLLEKK